MRYRLRPVSKVITKKDKKKVLITIWVKGTLMHCWWECKLVQPLWKTVWRFLKKLRRVLSYDPAIPLLAVCPKNTKTLT